MKAGVIMRLPDTIYIEEVLKLRVKVSLKMV